MNYQEFIQNIVKTRGQWNVIGYYEKHHIIPKCLGGTGDYKNKRFKIKSHNQNCIWLTAEEHFIAHKLLVEQYPKNKKILKAFWSMCTINNKLNTGLSAKEYAEYRIVYSKINSGKNNPMFGKTHSSEARAKISKINKGIKRSVEFIQKRKEYMTGRHWYNNGKLEGLYLENEIPAGYLLGRLPIKSHPMSQETKEKLRQLNLGKKHSQETIEKIRQKNLDRIPYHNNSGKEIFVAKNMPVLPGYIKGFSEKHCINIKNGHLGLPGRQQSVAEKNKRSATLKEKYRLGEISQARESNGMFGKKHSQEAINKIRQKAKNFCWVCKEDEHPKRITLDKLEYYIANGWKRGRKVLINK